MVLARPGAVMGRGLIDRTGITMIETGTEIIVLYALQDVVVGTFMCRAIALGAGMTGSGMIDVAAGMRGMIAVITRVRIGRDWNTTTVVVGDTREAREAGAGVLCHRGREYAIASRLRGTYIVVEEVHFASVGVEKILAFKVVSRVTQATFGR